MTDIADEDLDGIAEVGRTLLRDIARIRGTRPPALAAVEDFVLAWLKASPDHGDWPVLPTAFLVAYGAWQKSLPVEHELDEEHELDDPIETMFWDLDLWLGLVCMPPCRLPPPGPLRPARAPPPLPQPSKQPHRSAGGWKNAWMSLSHLSHCAVSAAG